MNTGAIEALAFNTVTDKVSERPMAVPGPFFFEAPTETVGRRPCSHGGGPLRELDGQCPPSPIAGSPVPCSAPSGALRRNTKGMRAPIGPLRSGFRPPPLAPAKGGPLATDRRCSGASACRFASPLRRGPRPPAPLASGYRRLCPPVAPPPSRPPRSPRYALRAARTAPALGPAARPWAAPGGPASRPTRHCGFASGPSAPEPRRVPPRRPLLVVAGRSVPSLRHVGRATGSAPPAWGLERPCGPLSPAPGPRRFWKKQPGG